MATLKDLVALREAASQNYMTLNLVMTQTFVRIFYESDKCDYLRLEEATMLERWQEHPTYDGKETAVSKLFEQYDRLLAEVPKAGFWRGIKLQLKLAFIRNQELYIPDVADYMFEIFRTTGGTLKEFQRLATKVVTNPSLSAYEK